MWSDNFLENKYIDIKLKRHTLYGKSNCSKIISLYRRTVFKERLLANKNIENFKIKSVTKTLAIKSL